MVLTPDKYLPRRFHADHVVAAIEKPLDAAPDVFTFDGHL